MTLLDKPRLGYPTRYGIKPSETGGKAEGKFTFVIPMLRDVKAEDMGGHEKVPLEDVVIKSVRVKK